MIDSYTYYGKKNSRYYAKSFNLYPATMQRLLVECCMGSGNQTANSLYGESVRRIAIEKDRSIYLLNKAIKENPYETIRALEAMVYSKDEYEKARQIVDKVNAGTIMADKPYYVYMTAGANKFLRIYYGRVKEYLASLPES